MSRLQSAAGRVPGNWSFGQWPLRRKLAAAVALPLVLAFAFGGLRVKSDYDSSQQLSRAADTLTVIRPVVEYNLAVQRLAAAESVGGGGVISAITKYESAAANLRIAVKAQNVPDTVKKSAQTALSLGQAVRAAKTQNPFSDIVIDKSGSTATLMSTAVADLGLSDDSDSAKIVSQLQDTIAAQRAATAQQVNLANADDASANLRALAQAGAESGALSTLPSGAGAAGDLVRQLKNDSGRRSLTLQQQAPSRAQVEGLAPVFESSSSGYQRLMESQLTALEANLRSRAANLRFTAIINAVIVALALLAALLLVFGLLRSLLTPIRAVREGALAVARERLPEAVARIRDGEEPPAFQPIPVHTTEEMGQLARAVDDLHTQALTLAGDQARLRVQVGHMFETLSRRSTSLIDQQLSLIERLESDEEDPKRLQSLFRLDHLAARMRRNSDSLLVLAGTSTRRGVSGAVSVSDAVRAAVSEVENYERIDIGDTSSDQVLGAVGSDLIHLVAEVVDNALAYSPPTTRVAIRGARTPEGGLLIEVTDHGLGMPPKDLAELNDRLANGGDITADTARRMGLFVVGSLAKRHGIAVRLRRNGDDKQGITVSVHLPAGLLADSVGVVDRPSRASAAQAPAATVAPAASPTSSVGGVTKAGLPTRVRGASGAPSQGTTPSPVPGAAKKVLPTRTPGAHGPNASTALPPAKPVIEGTEPAATDQAGSDSANADPANTGAAAVNGDAPKVNGKAADAAVNGSTPEAPVNGQAPADPTTPDAAALDRTAQTRAERKSERNAETKSEARTRAKDEAKVRADEAAKVRADEEPKVVAKDEATVVARDDATVATKAEATTPDVDAAPVQRSAAGLPVRKPRASQITEYREFADAPTAPEPSGDTKAAAPARAEGKGSRLTSWLPSRKAAARAEAEAVTEEPRQMPTNLSAWLDHRAKMAEASQGTDETAVTAVTAPASAEADQPRTDATTSDESAMHVPQAWVAEVTGEVTGEVTPEHTAEAAPEAVAPGASSLDASAAVAPEATADPEAPQAEGGRDAGLPTRVPGASGSTETNPLLSADTPAGRPALRAHNTSFFGARRARAVDPTTEPATAVAEPAAVADPEPVAERAPEPVAEQAEQVEQVETPSEVVAEQVEQVETPSEVVVEQVEQVGTPSDVAPEAVQTDDQAPEQGPEPTPDANDTPIFRAMMSRWLTDDTVAATETWTPTDVDQAWDAAARIEQAEPLEESSAGLPMRRPGSQLIPGAMEDAPAPTPNRRDPEAIRRNLNRHKNGVSSARTEAQDDNHREEADVHH